MWTVLIGENGTAKTSILQAIALAAVGSRQVNRLAGALSPYLRDRRADDAKLVIDAEFSVQGMVAAEGTEPVSGDVSSTVEMSPGESDLEATAGFMQDRLVQARSRNERGWFVAAYGVARALPEPKATPPLDQPSLERLETLFRPNVGLTALDFASHFDGPNRQKFVNLLKKALRVHDSLVPRVVDVELRGRGGVRTAGDLMERDRFQQAIGEFRQKVPAIALSHGYQSTIAWIADLIGHAILDDPGIEKLEDVRGLVLIDEIDLYLHPTWQTGLVDALRKTFPNVQFVVSTHSPVVLSGVHPDEIVRLGHDDRTGDVVRLVHDAESGELKPRTNGEAPDLRGEPDPRRMTGSEIYRDWFGLDGLTLSPWGEKLKRYRWLSGDPYRDDGAEGERKKLEKELKRAGIRGLPEPTTRESR